MTGTIRRWLARTGFGCVCCGTLRRLLWRQGDNPFAIVTICIRCKFGGCDTCR